MGRTGVVGLMGGFGVTGADEGVGGGFGLKFAEFPASKMAVSVP